MFNWYAVLDNAKQRIAELENGISIVREGLQRAESEADKSMAQWILAVREQELERTKVYVEFIESKLAASPIRGTDEALNEEPAMPQPSTRPIDPRGQHRS
jgi:hypothetical protein